MAVLITEQCVLEYSIVLTVRISFDGAPANKREYEKIFPMTAKHKLIHLANRPSGFPSTEDFVTVERTLPEIGENELLVENHYLSVDPYMRELMDAGWETNEPLEGRAVGRVLQSSDPEIAEGEWVFHRNGWRTHALVASSDIRRLASYDGVPTSAFLSALGGTGLSAYVALTRIAQLQPSEAIFISAAAGGVGTMAGQIARLLGASRVVGSTGSASKAKYLTHELGFDAAFDYRSSSIDDQLHTAATEGIDVYLDNVGGKHLEAAIENLRDHGRIAWCGAVGQYNGQAVITPSNLFSIVEKSIKLEGFLVKNYRHLQDELENFLVPHLQSGCVKLSETVTVGFDNMVTAFIGMLKGENIGKAVVKV